MGAQEKFAVVKFTEEDDALGVIPLCWVIDNGKKCLYPDAVNEEKKNKLLRGEAMPLPSWTCHDISIMKSYSTYNEARQKLKLAEDTSNLESEGESGMRRKRKKREIRLLGEESSSEDETLPRKPKKYFRPTHSFPYPPTDSFSKVTSLSTFTSSPNASPNSSSCLTPVQDNYSPRHMEKHKASSQSFLKTPPSHSNKVKEGDSTFTSSPIATPNSSSCLTPVQDNFSPRHMEKHMASSQSFLKTPPSHSNKVKWGRDVTVDGVDIERLWTTLGNLQATVISQSQELTLLHQKIDTLLSRGHDTTPIEKDDTIILHCLPISSMEEFDEFEEKLRKQEIRSLVVNLLATLGGKDSKTLMFNCMKRCLTSELGMKFSFTGKPSKDQNKETKRAFVSTALCSAIQSATRRIYPTTTEDHIKINIGHWLQQSRNRAIPRANRAQEGNV